jgi:hypothetical protein
MKKEQHLYVREFFVKIFEVAVRNFVPKRVDGEEQRHGVRLKDDDCNKKKNKNKQSGIRRESKRDEKREQSREKDIQTVSFSFEFTFVCILSELLSPD